MKRPSFQFYPGDWAANPNLKRCTFAERGIWLEVMCLMHDQESYGVLRWPLKDIAQAVGCKPADLQTLARKGVLKGDDTHLAEPYIYTPRSGRKDGDPVTLVAPQPGPIWYSSRMVKDEYVRTIRGESAGTGESPKKTPKATPTGGIGAAFGPRGSSSSSSSSDDSSSLPKREPEEIGPPLGGSEDDDEPPEIDAEPTPYGAITQALRKAGVGRLNPGHLTFRALVDAGATADEFLAYVDGALTKRDPFLYLLSVVETARTEAKKVGAAVLHGALPAAPEAPWRRAERERNEAFAGRAAAKPTTPRTMETIDVATRAVD